MICKQAWIFLRKYELSNDLPLILKICVSKSLHREDNSVFAKFGYENEKKFYMGEVTGEDWVGWQDSNMNFYLSGK